jgi:hypothetical protein
MNDYQLKLVLTVLGGVVFSFIFILLAFALPTHTKKFHPIISKSKVGAIANSARNR